MSIWNHRSVATVWALNLTYIVEFLSFARVLRHFVLVPCEICVKKLLLTETIYSRDQQYFIKKLPLPTLLHNRRFYPQSTSWLHQLVDTPRHKRAYASQSSFRHGGWAARPAAGHKIADGKRKKTCHMTCLFSNRQLSILPGRFQPSTFDV